ncbi:MAG TPA: HlyD family secretion protein [Halomonas sp.]|nr:HlyD family secretion protein [Halomonas sp.]
MSDTPPDRQDSGHIAHEQRDERRHIRLQLPFRVAFDQQPPLEGYDLSISGFAVYSTTPTEKDALRQGQLLVAAGSAEFSVPFQGRCLRSRFDESQGRYLEAFTFTQLEPSQRELLRRVMRAFLEGRHASVEELTGAQDPQTPRRTASHSPLEEQAGSARRLWRYGLLLTVLVLLVLIGAATLYRHFLLVEPQFAAISAPRVDIVSPGDGVLENLGLVAGDSVIRDQPLVSVRAEALEADLALARAGQRFNHRLIDNLQESLDNSDTNRVSVYNATRPDDFRASGYAIVDANIARARSEQLAASVEFEKARVNALETRAAGLKLYSPCDCMVGWAVNGAGNVYVQKGDRLMTLIETREDQTLVEALVHMKDIGRIKPHQMAFVRLPNSNEIIESRVRSVALDVERQPRAGFPQWVRQQQNVASVLLIPEHPLPTSLVGYPVEVRFSDSPMLAASADWVWRQLTDAAHWLEDFGRRESAAPASELGAEEGS